MIRRISRLKDIIRFLFGYPLTILSFYFIFKIIFFSLDKLKSNIESINVAVLMLGLMCFIIFYFIRSLIWKMVLEKIGYKTEMSTSLYLFSFTEIRKYIPGNIFSFASRVDMFNKRFDIPQTLLIKSIFVEFLIMVFSSALVSIPGTFYVKDILIKQGFFNYINPSFVVLCLVLGFTILYVYKFKKIKVSGLKNTVVNYFSFLDIFLVSCLMWLFFGLGSYLISASFTYLDVNLFLYLCSFFVFTWLIGYVSLITPAGLGVREVVFIAGLSSVVSMPVSTLIAVVSRISIVIAEIINLFLLYLIYKVSFVKQIFSWIALRKYKIILLIAVALYNVYFNYVSFEKHLNFFTGRFDLGNMDQTVWNTLNGRVFTLTNPDGINTISRLGIHADFILILLSPLYALWQDPRMLLLIQTLILSLGAVFIYLISKNVLKNNLLSLVFAISYLLNPWLQKQNLYDFHPVTLATTFLLAAIFFYIKNQFSYFFIFLILSVLTKESVYLISAIIGVCLLVKGKRLYGTFTLILSLLLFYLLVAVFIPQARGENHFAISYFQEFGDSPIQIIKNIIIYPNKTIASLVTVDNLNYLLTLMLSTGFIELFNPFYLIFTIPTLFINLLSNNHNLKSINFHYAATIIPFVYISSIYGAKTILKKFKKVNIKILTYYILFFSLFSSWMYGVLPGSRNPSVEIFTNKTAGNKEIIQFVSQIPSNISITTTNNMGAHLSHRERIYTIPNGVDNADMILFLVNDVFAQPSLEAQKMMVNELRLNKNYKLVKQVDDVFWAFEKIRAY